MIRTFIIAACLLAVAACGTSQPASAPASDVDSPQAAAASQESKPLVSNSYFDAQQALAADDFDAAKTALTALAGDSEEPVKAHAEAAANSADIVAMRAAFKTLSDDVINMHLPEGYAVAFCPMYDGMKGAYWAQARSTLANPYFGKSMLTCGEFKN